jgi:hypothetical protein
MPHGNYRKLRVEFLEWIGAFKRFPVRKTFLAFCAQQLGRPCAYAEFAALRRGDAVREHVVLALASFLLNMHPIDKVRFAVRSFGDTPETITSNISFLCGDPKKDFASTFESGQWPALRPLLEWAIETDSESVMGLQEWLPQGDREVTAAATLVTETVGRHASSRVIGRIRPSEAIRVGERILKRKVHELGHEFRQFHSRQPGSIAILRAGKGEIVAASACLSLTDDVYQRLRVGEIRDDNIPLVGLAVSTGNIFMLAAGQVDESGYCGQVPSVAQLRMWQVSALAGPAYSKTRLLTANPLPAGYGTMNEWGFRATGGFRQRDGHQLSELDCRSMEAIQPRVLILVLEWLQFQRKRLSRHNRPRSDSAPAEVDVKRGR